MTCADKIDLCLLLAAQERAQRAEVARLEDELNYMKQIAEVQQSTAMQDLMEAEAALLVCEGTILFF